jgi:hypothetical protein
VKIAGYEVSPVLLAALILVVLTDYGLKAWAVIDLMPRANERIRWGNRWVWLTLILLVNLLGSLSYFAFGRLHPTMSDEAAAEIVSRPAADRAQAAVDLLYGPRDEEEA